MGDRRGLTSGDATVVVALLVFIVAWVTGWLGLLAWADSDGDLADVDDLVLVFLLWMVVGPCVWAGHLVRHIITDET